MEYKVSFWSNYSNNYFHRSFKRIDSAVDALFFYIEDNTNNTCKDFKIERNGVDITKEILGDPIYREKYYRGLF